MRGRRVSSFIAMSRDKEHPTPGAKLYRFPKNNNQ